VTLNLHSTYQLSFLFYLNTNSTILTNHFNASTRITNGFADVEFFLS